MSWFKKETKCPEGSVHAWEYNGVLFKTKQARDWAEERDILHKRKEEFIEKVYQQLRKDLPNPYDIEAIRIHRIYRSCIGAIWDAGVRGPYLNK